MVASDIGQSKTCPQWAFERDLNSSRLVTQNMSEDGMYAITRIELFLKEPTTKIEHVEQLLQCGARWLQELCDGVILQRRAAREMFMGLRKLIGHNVKAIKDGVKVLRSAQADVGQANRGLSGVKEQVMVLKVGSLAALKEIEQNNKELHERASKATEQLKMTERTLREQEEKYADAERNLREVKDQHDEADRQTTKQLSDLQTLQDALNFKFSSVEAELQAEREKFTTERLQYEGKMQELNMNMDKEKSKALDAMEQARRLQAELLSQKQITEATEGEISNVERQRRENAEKSREECLLSLRKAEQEIVGLTKWAHMELQKKDEVIAGLLEKNKELDKNVNSLLKTKVNGAGRAARQEDKPLTKARQESQEEKTERPNVSQKATLLCLNIEKTEVDKADSEKCTKLAINKGTGLEKNQGSCVVNESASDDEDKSRQKRTRGAHGSDGFKRRRASTRGPKSTVKSSRRRCDDGPSSARTAGIQISSGNGKRQQSEVREKHGEAVAGKLQDDDFLVCDDLYSDHVLE